MNRRLMSGLAAGLLLALVITVAALSGNPFDPATGAPVLRPVSDQLSPEAAEQEKQMAPTVQVVECAPGVAKYSPGIMPSRPLGFQETHPGFQVLSDGHCVMDTSKSGKVVEPERLDP